LALIKAFDFSSIPVRKKQNNTRIRLINKINTWFKDKYVEYLPKKQYDERLTGFISINS